MAGVGEKIICCVRYVVQSRQFHFVLPLTQHIRTNPAPRRWKRFAEVGRGTSGAFLFSRLRSPISRVTSTTLFPPEVAVWRHPGKTSEESPRCSVSALNLLPLTSHYPKIVFSFSHREPTADVCFVFPVGNWERGTELSGAQQ